MDRFELQPTPLLRSFVHSYWGLTRDLSAAGGFTVTPDRYLELIFFVNPPQAMSENAGAALPSCTLVNLLSKPLRIIANGVVSCAAARVHAWAAGMLEPETERYPEQPWFECPSVSVRMSVRLLTHCNAARKPK